MKTNNGMQTSWSKNKTKATLKHSTLKGSMTALKHGSKALYERTNDHRLLQRNPH